MEKAVALKHSGRVIGEQEVEQIRRTVELFPGLSLQEPASTISEHLGRYTAGGGVKRDACMKLLLKLEATGVVKLSERQKKPCKRHSMPPVPLSERTRAGLADQRFAWRGKAGWAADGGRERRETAFQRVSSI